MEKSYELALNLRHSVKVLVWKATKPSHSEEDWNFFCPPQCEPTTEGNQWEKGFKGYEVITGDYGHGILNHSIGGVRAISYIMGMRVV